MPWADTNNAGDQDGDAMRSIAIPKKLRGAAWQQVTLQYAMLARIAPGNEACAQNSSCKAEADMPPCWLYMLLRHPLATKMALLQ